MAIKLSFDIPSFPKTEQYLKKLQRNDRIKDILEKGGKQGVEALRAATPVRSGLTASSWSYRIEGHHGGSRIVWYNTNTNKGENIAMLIQYGHGTGTGGYVSGIDYINPALRGVFEDLANEIWKEVTRVE